MTEYGKEGCFVKLKGNRNKHQVKSIEHIGNHSSDMVVIVELKTGDRTSTTWKNLRPWE